MDGVIQPQDLVRCQKPIYLLKKLLWTAHKPQLELFSSDSCFSVGWLLGAVLASQQYLAGRLLPLPTAERCARVPSPEGAVPHFAQPPSVQEAEAKRALGSKRRVPAQPSAAGRLRWHRAEHPVLFSIHRGVQESFENTADCN